MRGVSLCDGAFAGPCDPTPAGVHTGRRNSARTRRTTLDAAYRRACLGKRSRRASARTEADHLTEHAVKGPSRKSRSDTVETLAPRQGSRLLTQLTCSGERKGVQMDRRWRLLLIPAIASSALVPAKLDALSLEGEIGATSRASLGISLTIAPRMGFRGPNGRSSGVRTGETVPQSWCVWSSASLRSYTIMVQHQPHGHSLAWSVDGASKVVPLVSGTPLEAVAQSSAAECDESTGAKNVLVTSPSQGAIEGDSRRESILLILAPQ